MKSFAALVTLLLFVYYFLSQSDHSAYIAYFNEAVSFARQETGAVVNSLETKYTATSTTTKKTSSLTTNKTKTAK